MQGLIDTDVLLNIANAIRSKTNSTNKYTPCANGDYNRNLKCGICF